MQLPVYALTFIPTCAFMFVVSLFSFCECIIALISAYIKSIMYFWLA